MVSAVYDIGRERADGRGLADYLGWLRTTLLVFPEMIVYTDLEIIAELVPDSQVRWVPMTSWPPFRHRPKIEALLQHTKYSAATDITLRLPNYALLQFSKFFMLSDALSSDGDAPAAFWIDAGASRFFRHDGTATFPRTPAPGWMRKWLTNDESDSLFEVDLRRNLDGRGRIRPPRVGSSRRCMSGTSFAVKRLATSKFESLVLGTISGWTDSFQWDNEQVALTHWVVDGSVSPTLFLQTRAEPGLIARLLLEQERALRVPQFLVRRSVRLRT